MVLGTALTSYASVVASPTRPCAQPDGRVDAMAFSGSTLYLGGSFTHVKNKAGVSSVRGGLAAIDTASCDLTSWTAPTDGTVLDLVVSGTTVYVGRRVQARRRPDPHPARCARRDVGGRPALRSRSSTSRSTPCWCPASTLYAGGKFTKVGAVARNRLAAFDLGTGAPQRGLAAERQRRRRHPRARVRTASTSTSAARSRRSTGSAAHAYLGAVDADSGGNDSTSSPAPAYPILDLEADARGVYAGGGGHGGHLDIYNLDGIQQQPTYQTDGNVQAVAVDGDSLWAGGHFTNFCVGGTGAGAPFICDQNLERRKALEVSLGTGAAHAAGSRRSTARSGCWSPGSTR